MTPRASIITTHVSAAALAGLALVLAVLDWEAADLPEGARRQLLVSYLLANAVALEIYLGTIRFVAQSGWHHTVLIAVYFFNAICFRALALANILIAIAGTYATGAPTWILSLALLGVGQFLLARFLNVERGVGEWTEADIIQFFAQESPRYMRWLKFKQLAYGTANLVAGVLAIVAGTAIVAVTTKTGYAAFIDRAEPTTVSLLDNAKSGVDMVMSRPDLWFVVILAGLAGAGIQALGEAVAGWWRGERTAEPFD